MHAKALTVGPQPRCLEAGVDYHIEAHGVAIHPSARFRARRVEPEDRDNARLDGRKLRLKSRGQGRHRATTKVRQLGQRHAAVA